MACYHPLKGVRGGVNSNGKRPLLFDVRVVDCGSQIPIQVPCGQCVGCRLERSRQWAMRCMDEAQMHKNNSFITLTFNDKNLPKDGSLDVRHFQLFMKKLRKTIKQSVRYYHCGEYGEKFGRPHYHACLFGYGFPDKYLFKLTNTGFKLYRSPILERVWPFGNSMIGDVTFESAAYVARYVMKKITGEMADEHYVNKRTGELRKPEYTTMSRRPGIGFSWFEKYSKDVFPSGTKVVRGVEVRCPRYYDQLYEKRDPVGFAKLKGYRNSLIDFEENSSYRLAVKEEVTLHKIKLLKRELENV